jgi:predicted nuclease of predicted toxin-antitoxin system
VKLLLDENLSRRLAARLQDLYPGTAHVEDLGLGSSDDEAVWQGAKGEGYAIVSKDSDFHQRSFVFGHPPKVVWIRLGNCTTQDIEDILRDRSADLLAFDLDSEASFLVLSR